MKKETKTAPQTAVPEKPAAPERVHGLDLISKYRGAIMGFAALWILFFHEWVTLFVNNQVGVNIEGYSSVSAFAAWISFSCSPASV